MNIVAVAALALVGLVTPEKTWFAPEQEWVVNVKGAEAGTRLVMTDFTGKPQSAAGPTDVTGDAAVDLRRMFPGVGTTPDTYLLYVVREGEANAAGFLGTPLVVDVREDARRPGSGPMVVRVDPLRYGVIHTEQGPMTVMFYYDVAPNTVANFISLSEAGFYDGLTFHRIVPGFVIQGGDPTGTGTGGPGHHVGAEFNDRPHLDGVLSMARSSDPNEAAGAMPRAEFADSAGSQFFICLDYAVTRKLDHRYTAFGRVVDGMDAVTALAKTPVADPKTGRPTTQPVIRKVEILPVTAEQNPYVKTVKLESVPTTAPVAAPVPPGSTTRGVPLEPPARVPAMEAE